MRLGATLALASALLALGIFEGGLRVAGYGEARPGEVRMGEDGRVENFTTRGGAFDPVRAVHYTLNRHGFRGADWGEGPPGAPAVAVLGDSFTFGIGVPDHATLPVQLAAALGGGPVVNLGESGSNTLQQEWIAARWLPVLGAREAVLVVTGNDAEVMPWNPDPVRRCGLDVGPGEAVEWAIFRHLYVWRPVRAVLVDPGCMGPRRCSANFQSPTPAGRCFRAALRRLIDVVRAAGAEPLVAFYPTPVQDWRRGAPPPDAASGEALEGLAAAEGADFLDLAAAFEGLGGTDLKIATDPWHPSGFAHCLAAAELAARLACPGSGAAGPPEAADGCAPPRDAVRAACTARWPR
ncbi:SGNH/GDSL hydrolase family protein [Myxococcota bacterium]|nr:SGNH/GDSL hydrolase family protein [Myxococcota bacterium]